MASSIQRSRLSRGKATLDPTRRIASTLGLALLLTALLCTSAGAQAQAPRQGSLEPVGPEGAVGVFAAEERSSLLHPRAGTAEPAGPLERLGLQEEPRDGAGARDPAATRIPGRYIVAFRDSVRNPGRLARAQVRERGGRLGFVYRHTLKGYSAKLSKGAVQALRKDPRVRYVVADHEVEAFAQTVPTGVQRISADENEALDIDGEDDVRVDADVAVLDTGVDLEHPDLNLAGRTDCTTEADGVLNYPTGVDIGAEGSVWVADSKNDRIQEFNAAGEHLFQFGSSGTEPGQFDLPYDLAVDPEGDIWVVDTRNNRIQGFSPEGELLQAFGSEGSEPGQLKIPWALTTDSEGDIWVTDTNNNRIQEFSPEGELLQVFGSKGSEPGQFKEPSGIAIAEGKIWVSDTNNDRVQVFNPEGEYLFQFGESGTENGQFHRSRGIAIDGEGNAWVSDQGSHRVQKFDPEGKYLEQFGEVGNGPGQFGSPLSEGPRGLAIDPEGFIFAADPVNHRVQKWSLGPPPSFSLSFGPGCVDGAGADGHGHGTHVAGTIGAIDNAEGVVGVAPGARIWAVRVLDDEGSGKLSGIVAGIEWVTATREDGDPENDIEVANMSLGCFCPKWAAQPTEDAISGYEEGEEHVPGAVDKGVVVVVAAGNEAAPITEGESAVMPAANPDAITVSALADTDGKAGGEGPEGCYDDIPGVTRVYTDDALAYFSNWGAEVDIAAPGGCILSSYPGSEYKTISGTSMASPHAAGAAAVLAAKSEPEAKQDVEAIRDELVDAASLAWADTGPDPHEPLLYLGGEPLGEQEAATGGAGEITFEGATLYGAVATRGLKASYRFEYGPSEEYGNSVPATPAQIAEGGGYVAVSEELEGLEEGATYHYRIAATDSEGEPLNGRDRTFTIPRRATATAASEVSESAATLNGAFLLEGETPSYTFEYGPTAEYGSSVAAEVVENETYEANGYEQLVATPSGLAKNTTYHFRLVASSGGEKYYSQDETFRTAVWAEQPTEDPEKGTSPMFLGLSCITATDCHAVGTGLLAEHWDGEQWSIVSTPEELYGWEILWDVSCVPSQSFCLAVGDLATEFDCEEPPCEPPVLQWDGEAWTRLSVPIPSDADNASLWGVSCPSTTFCMATGSYRPEGVGHREYWTLQWDGESLTELSVPVENSNSFAYHLLIDVSCSSASFCLAVGSPVPALRWDGSEWKTISAPNEALSAVSCVSASSCQAVGPFSGAQWDGEALTSVSTPWLVSELGALARLEFRGMSCAAAWSCVAVAWVDIYDQFGNPIEHPLAMRWDGNRWTLEAIATEPIKEPTDGTGLYDVWCGSPAQCIAGGFQDEHESPLAMHYEYEATAPTATTGQATGIGKDEATLNGAVDSGALSTTYQFEYDTKPYGEAEEPHGTKVPAQPKDAGSGTEELEVSQNVEGLELGVTYHYRIVATNGEGTDYGESRSFETLHAPRFEAQSYPATISGELAPEEEHVFDFVGLGDSVGCKAASFAGEAEGHSATRSLAASYSECESSGGVSVTIEPNGCTYVLDAGEAVWQGEYTGSLDIACPEEAVIEIQIATCRVEIPAQSGLDAVFLANDEEASPQRFEADFDLSGIEYSYIDGFLCPFEGSGEKADGKLTGNTVLSGENEAEEPTGVRVDGVELEEHAPRFEAQQYPATISGEQDAEDPHVFELLDQETVSCGEATFAGQAEGHSTTLALGPSYSECVSSGEVSATFEPNGCTYVLDAGEALWGGEYTGSAEISCPEEATIEIQIAICKYEIPAQSGLDAVIYANDAEASPQRLEADFALTGIEYSYTDGFLCPFDGNGEKADGKLTGNTVLSGENEAEEPTGVRVDGE